MTETPLIPHIAVIGAGYWGKNLVRNFHQLGVLSHVLSEGPVFICE